MSTPQRIDLFNYHHRVNQNNLFCYKGPFDKTFIAFFNEKLQIMTGRQMPLSKKVTSVFIELGQNIGFYSTERVDIENSESIGIGTFILNETPDSLVFAFGNNVGNDKIETLKRKCEMINSLDHDSLREYKREQRNLVPGSNGGAHIGLIMVALVTNRQLDVSFTPCDDESTFFSLTVTVPKQ